MEFRLWRESRNAKFSNVNPESECRFAIVGTGRPSIKKRQCLQIIPSVSAVSVNLCSDWQDKYIFRKKFTFLSNIRPSGSTAKGRIAMKLILNGVSDIRTNKSQTLGIDLAEWEWALCVTRSHDKQPSVSQSVGMASMTSEGANRFVRGYR